MNRETYKEQNARQQAEVDALPIKFAFSVEQYNSALAALNVQPGEEADKLYRLGDTGGFYLKTDGELIASTFKRHAEEREAAINGDPDGTGFIYEMFLYELQNHEYSYTGRTEDTLAELNLTREEIDQNEALYNGLVKAIETIKGQADVF